MPPGRAPATRRRGGRRASAGGASGPPTAPRADAARARMLRLARTFEEHDQYGFGARIADLAEHAHGGHRGLVRAGPAGVGALRDLDERRHCRRPHLDEVRRDGGGGPARGVGERPRRGHRRPWGRPIAASCAPPPCAHRRSRRSISPTRASTARPTSCGRAGWPNRRAASDCASAAPPRRAARSPALEVVRDADRLRPAQHGAVAQQEFHHDGLPPGAVRAVAPRPR